MDANTNRSSKLLSLCVFCGSSMGKRLSYAEAAEKLGRTLAEQGMVLVYGGGDVGLMGIVAEAVMKNGSTLPISGLEDTSILENASNVNNKYKYAFTLLFMDLSPHRRARYQNYPNL